MGNATSGCGGNVIINKTEVTCPKVIACITAQPTGAPAVAGDLVLGSDAQFHALPSAVVVPEFATPAQTIAGTATNLIVNPADLYARENIPAQTGLSNDVTAIPAPTASQSVWGVNQLGETLHYAPGLGWQIVNFRYGESKSLPANIPLVNGVITDFLSITAPRAGVVTATSSQMFLAAGGQMSNTALYIKKNGVLIRRFGGESPSAHTLNLVSVREFSGAVTNLAVAAGDILTLCGQAFDIGSTAVAHTSLSDFSMKYED